MTGATMTSAWVKSRGLGFDTIRGEQRRWVAQRISSKNSLKEGVAAIDAFIDDRQSEEPYLDFKQSTDRGAGRKLNQNDRVNLARAISGFGNSEGGVVVWGDCRNLPMDGDVAKAKFPIVNPKRFKSWLEGAVSGCTVPAHPSVRHQAIDMVNGEGFVVTHVPTSYLAPHQSVYDLKYYMRAGSDVLPVPHAVLAGMFGRRPPGLGGHSLGHSPSRFPMGAMEHQGCSLNGR
jgi:hypothetical protein